MTHHPRATAEQLDLQCSRRQAVAALALAPLGLFGCGSQTDPPNRSHEAAVEDLIAAYNAHDLEGVLAFFSDEPSVTVNTQALSNREALRAFFVEYGATTGATPFTNAEMIPEDIYPGEDVVAFMGRMLGVREGEVSGFAAAPIIQSVIPMGMVCEFDTDGRCSRCSIFLNWGALLPTPV